jgi:6-phosphogluconate dehydrogenase
MNVGIVGLGKMGAAIAHRLVHAGHTVWGFDTDETLRAELVISGGNVVSSLSELCNHVSTIWLMVPVVAVDTVLDVLLPHLSPRSIIIDGGNSYYKDSIARAERCATKSVTFIDCGTSGGVHGKQHGFCLMVGGPVDIFNTLRPIFDAVAAPEGVIHVGVTGTGHYVKMIHNGVEYGILQAYAEGFHLLKEGTYKDQLDLARIAHVWNHGSIIRSFILQLAHQILEKDQSLQRVGGAIQELGTGQWTLQEAHDARIPTPVLEQALQVRAWSRQSGGNFATKLIALLRNAFGGHSVTGQK